MSQSLSYKRKSQIFNSKQPLTPPPPSSHQLCLKTRFSSTGVGFIQNNYKYTLERQLVKDKGNRWRMAESNHLDNYLKTLILLLPIGMITSQSKITGLEAKYREYLEKLSLTEEAKVRTFELINELGLIHLIYSTTQEQNKRAIDDKLKEVEKVVDTKLKGQGWMTFFSKVSEVVTLEEVWRVISCFQNDPRQHLINDICRLKLTSATKPIIVASTST